MDAYAADVATKKMIEAGLAPKNATVVFLGITLRRTAKTQRTVKKLISSKD